MWLDTLTFGAVITIFNLILLVMALAILGWVGWDLWREKHGALTKTSKARTDL